MRLFHPLRTAFALTLCASAVAALAQEVAPPNGEMPADDTRVEKLGTVTVTGGRVTTLPTTLPTTIEGIQAERIDRVINATDSADALKYFPSLLVRKRYIGDYDHAVLSTRASGTGNSARSLIYADGILLSNLLGNGASFTPRWGLVTPEEIARVDVLYGPFSAAYPGNSVGAVVDYITRMPERFEAHGKLTYAQQHFTLYRTDVTPKTKQGSVSLGDRWKSNGGDWSWWLHVSRQDSQSHPLVYATRTPSTANPATGAIVVTGAVAELNRFNQPWLLIGTTNHADTQQDHAKLKLAWQVAPGLKASVTLGLWDNTVARASEGWLTDASGARIELNPGNLPISGSRAVSLDGKGYSLTAADFGQTREKLQHVMHGVALRQATGGDFDGQLAASRYDYRQDQVRAWAPTTGAAFNPNAGRLTDQNGTGWNTLAARGTWRGLADHVIEFGLQREAAQLRNAVSSIAEWTAGVPSSAPVSRFEGNTSLTSLWGQDAVSLGEHWQAVLGLRGEQWSASRGLTANGAAVFQHPSRKLSALSPKFAIGWAFSDEGTLRLSTGRAVRFPTVSELFQGGVNASTGALTNGDPNLKPERSQTTDLSADWKLSVGTLRATVFHEATRDALYSQTNTTVTPNVTNIQNVDRMRTWGVELAAALNDAMVRGLDLSASVTFADSVITANAKFPASVGKWQPRVPRWRANAVASYRWDDALSTTLGLRYGGQQFNSLDNTDPNGARYQGASDFLVLDARIRVKVNRTWSAALGVDNLNNEVYWNFHPYPARTWVAELRFDL
jgi:iron complex outermembrane receptor protein